MIIVLVVLVFVIRKRKKKVSKDLEMVKLEVASQGSEQDELKQFLTSIRMSKHCNLLFTNGFNCKTMIDKTIEDLEAIGIPYDDSKVIISAIMAKSGAYLEQEIEIGKKVGGGAFGEVYEGVWRSTSVALKKLHDEEQISEFLAESKVLKDLRYFIF